MRHLALLPASLVPLALVDRALTTALAARLEVAGLFSAANLVRAHLLLYLAGLVLVTSYLIQATAASEFRRRLLLASLRAAFLAIAATVLLGLDSLIEEGGLMTFLTALVLAVAAAMAWLNHRQRELPETPNPASWNLFWVGLGGAFAFAALDEVLMIHEALGAALDQRSGSAAWLRQGDPLTGLYAVAALAFVGGSFVVFKPVFRRLSKEFGAILIGGALVFAAAALVDSCGFLVATLGTWTDFTLVAHAVEEALEFLAATMLLVSVVVAFLDRQQPETRSRLLGHAQSASGGSAHRVALVLCLLIFGSALTALAFLHREPPRVLAGDGGPLEVEVIVGPAASLRGANALALADGRLYFLNGKDGSILALAPDGSWKVVADAAAGLSSPQDLAIGASGSLFVADDGRIAVLRSSEAPGFESSRFETLLTREDGLRGAAGLAVGPDDSLYIADPRSSAVFHYDGVELTHYATSLQGLVAPSRMDFDRFGNLYVADAARHRVFRIAVSRAATTWVGENDEAAEPGAVAAWGDCLLLADRVSGNLWQIDRDGRQTRIATFAQRYRHLAGVEIDPQGSIYVLSSNVWPLPSTLFRLPSAASSRSGCWTGPTES